MITSVLAFVFPLALYLDLPSSMWNFDGVACAVALELGQPAYFFHANHLIYGFLGFLFWTRVGQPIGLSRALAALQLFTSLLSCFGLVGLYQLLLPILKNRWSALLLTLTLAVTAAFWTWSIEAQVYPLGFLALAWATFMLVQYQSPYKYIEVGILHGVAVLGHLMHFLWMIPALYWIVAECHHHFLSVSKAVRQYMTALAVVTVVPYLAVIGFVIAPGRDFKRVMIWLKGSAALTPDRSWAWHSVGWNGPWVWLKSTVPALWGSFWPYGNTHIAPWMWVLTIISIVLFLTLLIRGWTHENARLLRFSWLWIGVYGLFLSTWEPSTLCYRITDILPLGIFFALGLSLWRTPIQTFLVSLMLASTLTVNLFSRTLPMHRTDLNSVYQQTLSLSKITPANSLYIANDSLAWLYLLYFTGRTAWSAHQLEPQKLAAEMARQKRIRPVYVQKGSSWQQIH